MNAMKAERDAEMARRGQATKTFYAASRRSSRRCSTKPCVGMALAGRGSPVPAAQAAPAGLSQASRRRSLPLAIRAARSSAPPISAPP